MLAFSVITEIDDYYAKSLKNNLARGLLSEGVTLSFSKFGQDNGREMLDVNKSRCQKLINFLFHIFQAFYDSIYFYFMPFLVLYLTFVL